MRVKIVRLLGMAGLAVAMPAQAARPLANGQIEQYRQVGERFGLTPQQVAQVYALIDSQLGEIDAAARERQVNVTAFRAIARELGLRSYGVAPSRLIEAIRNQAETAEKFEKENGKLREQIAGLQDAKIRGPAETTLAQADAAYKAGNLDAAQASLEKLAALRTGELSNAGQAWESAVQAAISLAASRGDTDRLDRLVDEAAVARKLRAAQQSDADRHAEWENRMTQAAGYLAISDSSARFVKGRIQGKNAGILHALSIARDKALPLALREISPADWADTQSFIGIALRTMAGFETGPKHLREAIAIYRAVLEVQTHERDPVQWAAMQNVLGDALRMTGERVQGTSELKDAVTAHRAAMEVYSDNGESRMLTLSLLSRALDALGQREQALGDYDSGTPRLREVVKIRRAQLKEQDRSTNPLEWADAQRDLGRSLMMLSIWEDTAVRLNEAIEAFRLALSEQARQPDWNYASTQSGLGEALYNLGVSEGGIDRLTEAATAFRTALRAQGKPEQHAPTISPIAAAQDAVQAQRMSVDWGGTQISLAMTLSVVADRSGRNDVLEEAWHLVGEAQQFVREDNPPLAPWSDAVANDIRDIAARHGWQLSAASSTAL